ncbi:hypothetical protein STEG23_021596, partial [Scotinomys teguina]
MDTAYSKDLWEEKALEPHSTQSRCNKTIFKVLLSMTLLWHRSRVHESLRGCQEPSRGKRGPPQRVHEIETTTAKIYPEKGDPEPGDLDFLNLHLAKTAPARMMNHVTGEHPRVHQNTPLSGGLVPDPRKTPSCPPLDLKGFYRKKKCKIEGYKK